MPGEEGQVILKNRKNRKNKKQIQNHKIQKNTKYKIPKNKNKIQKYKNMARGSGVQRPTGSSGDPKPNLKK